MNRDHDYTALMAITLSMYVLAPDGWPLYAMLLAWSWVAVLPVVAWRLR